MMFHWKPSRSMVASTKIYVLAKILLFGFELFIGVRLKN